jgi:hypothetical protein
MVDTLNVVKEQDVIDIFEGNDNQPLSATMIAHKLGKTKLRDPLKKLINDMYDKKILHRKTVNGSYFAYTLNTTVQNTVTPPVETPPEVETASIPTYTIPNNPKYQFIPIDNTTYKVIIDGKETVLCPGERVLSINGENFVVEDIKDIIYAIDEFAANKGFVHYVAKTRGGMCVSSLTEDVIGSSILIELTVERFNKAGC